MRRVRVAAALIAPLALLTAACSSSGGGSGSSGGGLLGGSGGSSASSSASSGGSSSGGSTGGGTGSNLKTLSQSDLQSALLAASDLPGGDWTSKDPSGGSVQTDNPACTTVANADQDHTAVRAEADFTSGSGSPSEYDLILLEFPSVQAATAHLNAVKSAQGSCTSATVSDSGVSVQAQFVKGSAPSLGDGSADVRMRLAADGQQQSGSIVLVRKGATVVIVEAADTSGWSDPQPDAGVVRNAVQKYTQAAS